METGGERRFLAKIIDYFKSTPLSQIDQAGLERAVITLYPDAKASTRNRQFFTPVSAILKHAEKMGLASPKTITRPKQPQGKIRWLTPEEAGRLIESCSPHMKPLVTFLFYTGARLSEALYLDWRNVDLENRRVSFVDTKNGEARGVPLHPVIINILANSLNKSGRVFRRPDGHGYKIVKNAGGQIKTGFNAACRRAGIKNFTPHDCRHTFATWHYSRNRDPRGLMELCGWKSERMVWRYAHINRDDLAPGVLNIPEIELQGENSERLKIKR